MINQILKEVLKYKKFLIPALRAQKKINGLLYEETIDVKPMIADTLKFEDSIQAFERAAKNLPKDVKPQIIFFSNEN